MPDTELDEGPGSFNHTKFLEDNFNTPDGVINLVAKHFVPPQRPAVAKWFTRGSVPGEWWPVLLYVIEREKGAPISTAAFTKEEGQDYVDSIFS